MQCYRSALSLTDVGMHVCSIPICDGYYEESLFPIADDERERRFGQFDHVRRFGAEDLQLSLRMLFRLPKTYDLTSMFSQAVLKQANIPEQTWRGFSPHIVLAIRKDEMLLNSESSMRAAPRTFRSLKRFYQKKLYSA